MKAAFTFIQMRFWSLILLTFFALRSSAQLADKVRLLCDWNDTSLVPANADGQRYNEVWGFSWKGTEYGVIASTIGGHIINLNTCSQTAFLKAHNTGGIHRDYKTYRHYLYAVADEGQFSVLQIFDYSYLPDSVHLVYESDPYQLSRSHKIFIDTVTGKLYCASVTGLNTGHDYMRVYSLTKPDSPALLAVYNATTGGLDDVHDVYVRNDTAYCSSSGSGYAMVDCTHPPRCVVIGEMTHYIYAGFNHSSWIGADDIGVMTDETFGKPAKVIDVSDPDNIHVVGTFSPRGTDTTSVPHNPYLVGKFAFLSYYLDGLQIYDITDAAHPRQAGYYHTYTGPHVQNFVGAWGCYPFLPSRRVLISDTQGGLFVFNVDDAIGIHRDSTFVVFPNPVTNNDALHVRFRYGTSGAADCIVYDVCGRIVFRFSGALPDAAPLLALPLPRSLAAGMYLLRAAAGGQLFTARFIKR